MIEGAQTDTTLAGERSEIDILRESLASSRLQLVLAYHDVSSMDPARFRWLQQDIDVTSNLIGLWKDVRSLPIENQEQEAAHRVTMWEAYLDARGEEWTMPRYWFDVIIDGQINRSRALQEQRRIPDTGWGEIPLRGDQEGDPWEGLYDPITED